jgi:Starter unit:ACP transacylase in aflatoxin biosynthesis
MAIHTPSTESQEESRSLKLVYFSNEFPHDDLQDLYRRLHNHSKSAQHPVLSRFIQEATVAVREEVRQLPTQLRALLPAFETVFDFANYPELRKGPLCGSVDGILLCVVELGTLIGYLL